MIGAGGIGMSGLAKILAQAGHQVSGSDLKPSHALSALEGAGVEVWIGHRPEVAPSWDLVVASSAVPGRDAEIVAARAAGVEVWERPRLLSEITRRLPTIGVAGTHGKTSGSAMLLAGLRALGRDPSFMIGGELVDLNTNAHLGEEELFVLEVDEAFGTFLAVHLRGLVVTNVESDHLDHYRTVAHLEAAFHEVAAAVEGPVVACLDDAGARRLAVAVPGVVGYGTAPDAVWRIGQVTHGDSSVRFGLRGPDVSLDVTVPKPGEHVARNAAGVLALLGELGLDVVTAAEGLRDFAGVRRRFEVRSRIGGVIVVDDYAHHPTEVAATIAAATLGHPGRVVAVFQPHRFTRTAEHGVALGAALRGAQHAVVTDVYAAGEAPIPGVTGRMVAEAAVASGVDATYVARRGDVAASVASLVRPGDLVLLMGAGDITLVGDELPPLLDDRS
ncbi:MAG: UDP-N-acetylmuramate--L-alanine ligase [Acidimicrobiia bacterium]|nr:UDP-N-acetylmuramate--L-alanine ligase [Acidimicrobiia bacterium]